MESSVKKFIPITVLAVAALTLAAAYSFPQDTAVVLAGGPLRAAVLAGIVSAVAAAYPLETFLGAVLFIFIDPVFGVEVAKATSEQMAYLHYYMFGMLIVVLAPILNTLIVGHFTPDAITKNGAAQ